MTIAITFLLTLALPQDRFHWERQESGTHADLLAVEAVGGDAGEQVCWAVGAEGSVVRASDGRNWIRCDIPAADDLRLFGVDARDSKSALVFAEGPSPTFFVTQDGGVTWSRNLSGEGSWELSVSDRQHHITAKPAGSLANLLAESLESEAPYSDLLDPELWNMMDESPSGDRWAVGRGGRIARLRRSVGTAAWDRFRGPNGTGIAAGEGYPSRIGPATGVLWSRAFPAGHSSPILTAERLYLTGTEEGRLFTYAVNRKTGETLWRREAPRQRETVFHAKNHSAAASAAVDADVVVVFFDEFGALGYDHDGLELWRLPMGPFNNVYGMGASPILVGDLVVLPCDQSTDSFVVALHKETGEEVWRQPRPHALSGHCTPVVRTGPDGGQEVLLPGSYLLDAYAAASGERLWWVDGLPGEMKSVPVLLGDRLWIHGYASPLNDLGQQIRLPSFAEALGAGDRNGDGGLGAEELDDARVRGYFPFFDLEADGVLDEEEWGKAQLMLSSVNSAMAMKLGGSGDVTEENVLWRSYRSIPQLPSPLIYAGVYYLLADQGGLLTTLDPKSGETLERGRLVDAVDAYFTSPVAGGGFVYLTSETGIVSVLPAGGSLEPVHTARFEDPIFATPALEDGRIWLRTESRLYCFGDA